MAKKKNEHAETIRGASKKAVKAPLSCSAIRLAGFIIAFVGIMLILEKNSLSDIILTAISVALILGGLFTASGNFKHIAKRDNYTNAALYFIIGLLMIVAGVLFIVYKSSVSKWFVVILGCAIAAYGLVMLIKSIFVKRSKKMYVLDILCACFTIITGVLVALLCVPQIASASSGVCFYIFGGIAAAVGVAEILIY